MSMGGLSSMMTAGQAEGLMFGTKMDVPEQHLNSRCLNSNLNTIPLDIIPWSTSCFSLPSARPITSSAS
jgi:hypothetical protein